MTKEYYTTVTYQCIWCKKIRKEKISIGEVPKQWIKSYCIKSKKSVHLLITKSK